jgi:3-isopropylmalate dehydrogenase
MLASFAMALRYSFNMVALADRLEGAIAAVLAEGLRTGDIAQGGGKTVGTEEMGAAILKKLAA